MKSVIVAAVGLAFGITAHADRVFEDGVGNRYMIYEPTRLYMKAGGEIIEVSKSLESHDYAYAASGELLRLSGVNQLRQLSRVPVYVVTSSDANDRMHASSTRISVLQGLAETKSGNLVGYTAENGTYRDLPAGRRFMGVQGNQIDLLVKDLMTRNSIVIDAKALRALVNNANAAMARGDRGPKDALVKAISKIMGQPENAMDLRGAMGIAKMNPNGPLESELLRVADSAKKTWVAPVVTPVESVVKEATKAVVESGAAR